MAAVVKDIERHARKVQSSDEIAQVGTISANGDRAIGKMIAEAMKRVGKEGVITVEEANTAETGALDVVEGMQSDRGYLSPYFITSAEKMVAEAADSRGRGPDRQAAAHRSPRTSSEEGIVRGAGVALLRAKAAVGKLKDNNPDVQAGINIVLRR